MDQFVTVNTKTVVPRKDVVIVHQRRDGRVYVVYVLNGVEKNFTLNAEEGQNFCRWWYGEDL